MQRAPIYRHIDTWGEKIYNAIFLPLFQSLPWQCEKSSMCGFYVQTPFDLIAGRRVGPCKMIHSID